MSRIPQALVFGAVVLMIASYLVFNICLTPFVRGRWRKATVGNAVMQKFCWLGLWLMRVKVNVVNAPPASVQGFYVGNHLSYLDVLVISSAVKTSFVTSVEIKQTPVLGPICQMAGCLFVERRNKLNILAEIKELKEALRRRLNITIFPEATSTNGEQILRFRKPLYVAAMGSNVPVIPFCLNYLTAGGKPLTRDNRDNVFWYADMTFVPHLWRLIGNFGVEVDLIFASPIDSLKYPEVAELADASQKSVEALFQPVR